jgi:hypothetical protein
MGGIAVDLGMDPETRNGRLIHMCPARSPSGSSGIVKLAGATSGIFTLMNHARRFRSRAGAVRSDQPRLTKLLELAVIVSIVLVFISWLLIAVAHVDDRYNVGHVTGSWFALARYVNEGILYPPLFNGHAFGGTRYMPLQFVIHAGLARVTGEYLISGKLLAYLSAGALYALMFSICRSMSRSSVFAAGLVAAVLSTGAGLLDSTTVRGDTLPVALQLGALHAATRRSATLSSWPTAFAGLLCTLAFFSKLTAVWGAIALALWLVMRDRHRLSIFLVSLGGSAAVLFAGFEYASRGRMSQNIIDLAAPGMRISVAGTLTKFVELGQGSANAVWVLAPLAITTVGAAIVRRRLTVYQISLVFAVAILLLLLTDVGTDVNQLIDVEVLTALVVAEYAGSIRPRGRAVLWPLALAAILWGTFGGYQTNLRADTAIAVHSLLGQGSRYDPPLEHSITASDQILTEDPYVAIAHDEDPVLLDTFMLVRIAREHPEWQAALIRDIRHHRFTKVVLGEELDPNDEWFHIYSFGAPIATAIADSYRLVDVPDDFRPGGRYYVYEPKR